MFNSFGNLLKLTTFGESHGNAIGGIIDGFPAGMKVDFEVGPTWADLSTYKPENDYQEMLN